MRKKNSILLRPKPRHPSRRNETTFEKEYEKEQKKLAARRARRNRLEQSCLGRLNRDPDALEDARYVFIYDLYLYQHIQMYMLL